MAKEQFFSRNVERQKARIEQDEKEEAELLEALKPDEDEEETSNEKPENSGEKETPEEKETGWKKRYSDLRSHSAKKENEFKDTISKLEKRISELETGGEVELPQDEKELADWMEKYPEVATMIEKMASKIANDKLEETNTVLEDIKKDKEEAKRVTNEARIRKAHPDFDDLQEDDEFHDWVEEQSKLVQTAVYESGDPDDVIWAITTFKKDKKSKEKPKKKDNSAAENIDTKGKTSIDANAQKGQIRESDVARMSVDEYEAREEEITAAIRSGKFIYDVSGAAR